jgi:hypothetical protein
MAVLLYLGFVLWVSCWLYRRVKSGRCGTVRAIGLHSACTSMPVLLYGAVFLMLVGVEELAGTAIIGEGYARTLPLVLAGGAAIVLLATLVFALLMLVLIRRGNDADRLQR